MSSKTPVPAADAAPAHEENSVTPLEAFLEANFKKLLYAVVAIVIGMAAWYVIHANRQMAEEQAGMAFTSAKNTDDYAMVVSKHSGTAAAGNALLAKAKLEWDQTKKDSAVATLRAFAKNYTDHPFYLQGLISLATRLETMGPQNVEEARRIYEQIVKEHKDSELAGLAQIRLGDLLWSQGKEAEARQVYEAVPQKYPGQFFKQNENRLTLIKATLPTKEVEGPKPPPPPATPAAGNAPAINLTPGQPGGLGISQPFEIKPMPAPAAPGTTAPAPAPKAAPPAGTVPAPKANVVVPGKAAPQIKLTPPAAPKASVGVKSAPAVPPAPKPQAEAPKAPAEAPKAPAEAPKK